MKIKIVNLLIISIFLVVLLSACSVNTAPVAPHNVCIFDYPIVLLRTYGADSFTPKPEWGVRSTTTTYDSLELKEYMPSGSAENYVLTTTGRDKTIDCAVLEDLVRSDILAIRKW